MYISMILFTLGMSAVAMHQFTYWSKKGTRREAWVFLGWMIFAWVVGLCFIGGFRLPTPSKPLFPSWD